MGPALARLGALAKAGVFQRAARRGGIAWAGLSAGLVPSGDRLLLPQLLDVVRGESPIDERLDFIGIESGRIG